MSPAADTPISAGELLCTLLWPGVQDPLLQDVQSALRTNKKEHRILALSLGPTIPCLWPTVSLYPPR